MTDVADDAQQIEEWNLQLALAAHQQRVGTPEYDEDGNRVCVDCGAVIPTLRVLAVHAIRCVDCQAVREHQLKQGITV